MLIPDQTFTVSEIAQAGYASGVSPISFTVILSCSCCVLGLGPRLFSLLCLCSCLELCVSRLCSGLFVLCRFNRKMVW